MRTDRELLKLAADAASIELGDWSETENGFIRYYFITRHIWNPLINDGDALRLAVMLGLDIETHGCNTTHPYACVFDCESNIAEEVQPDDGDPYAATRRAIVMASAERAKIKSLNSR